MIQKARVLLSSFEEPFSTFHVNTLKEAFALHTSVLTVACLISPVAVCPAQKTSPGTLVAGQLCGLVGNFSLEMSWRDMVVVGQRRAESVYNYSDRIEANCTTEMEWWMYACLLNYQSAF